MQNKNYDHTKLDAMFNQINLELQHYTMRYDQAVRFFITGYALVPLLPY